MTAGKVIAIIFGIFFLFTSIGLIIGGGAIIAVSESLTDNDGYFTTPTISITPADNVIALRVDLGDIDFGDQDEDFRVSYVDPGEFLTFKINIDNSGDIYFVGITETTKANTYLAGIPYTEITNYDFDYRRDTLVGTIVYTTTNPSSNANLTTNLPEDRPGDFWEASNGGTSDEFTWNPEAGEYSIIFMRNDGTGNLDLRTSIGARVPILGAVGGFLLVFGFIMLFASVILFYLGARPTRRVAREQQVRVYSFQPPVQTESGSLVCSNCGSGLDNDAKFCAECGEKVVKVDETEHGVPSPKAMGATPVTTPATVTAAATSETYVIADFWTRFWAFLIDIIIVSIFVEVVRGILILFLRDFTFAWQFNNFFEFNFFFFSSFSLNGIALLVYWVATEYYRDGQSIGKSAMNLYVIREDGKKPELGDIVLSTIGKAFLLPIDFLIGYFTNEPKDGRAPLNQRLFQKFSKTLVVTKPTVNAPQVVYRAK